VGKGEREGQTGVEVRTLGDVLYANPAAPRAREEEWVRLVQRVAAGDQVALHALFSQSHRIVFTLIMRITSNRDTAEEVTLDVFHDVWRRASTYDAAGGSVVGWIMNQARSRAIDRLRYEQRKKRALDAGDVLPPPVAARGPHEAFHTKEQEGLLRGALQALTPAERRAIETAFFSELTYVETAARLNEPVGTVKTRIRSGLRKLREALAGKMAGS
jgi:RNA polymerase sigma-70 factor (ECF subfamily)